MRPARLAYTIKKSGFMKTQTADTDALKTLPLNVPWPLLGNITPAQFLKAYWQKEPVLIRQAIPGFKAPVNPDKLIKLALRDDAEARIIRHDATSWHVDHAPFQPDDIPERDQAAWTVLVQGVNLLDAKVNELLSLFRFVPDARLDDLMISFATDGGGVGPHLDSYDVFLLQAHGQRRWSIERQPDTTMLDNVPLKILKHFKPEDSWVLEPGDMLYLPPGVAHDGVAIGDCLTYSIGFRAPSYTELTMSILDKMAGSVTDERYSDPDRKPTETPARIPDDMLKKLVKEIMALRPSESALRRAIGEYLSEPKPTTCFMPPGRPLRAATLQKRAAEKGLRVDPATRMLYADGHIYINGDSYEVDAEVLPVLETFANQRFLTPQQCQDNPMDWELIELWFDEGWVILG